MAKMAKTNLKGFDDLFKSSEQPDDKLNGITSLPISKLQPFSKHPFKKHNPAKMRELADSIEERGIIVPVLVRPLDNGMYEIVLVITGLKRLHLRVWIPSHVIFGK